MSDDDQLRWFTKRGGERVLQYRIGLRWFDVLEVAEDEPQRDEEGHLAVRQGAVSDDRG